MLIETLFEKHVFINRIIVSDGEGGLITTYTEGAVFDATVTVNKSLVEAVRNIGNKDLPVPKYNVATPHNAKLEFGDIFKNIETDQYYIVTGKTASAPKIASYQYNLVTAEEWELPND